MNITKENTNGEVQELKIEIGKEDYAQRVETELKKQRHKAQIPGFRVGNAPMGLIRKQYEKPIIADVVNEILTEAIRKHIEENKLDVLFEPIPVDGKSEVDFENPDNFVFVYEIALQPEINVDFKKLPSITDFHIIANAEEKKQMIDQMQRRYGEYSQPEEIGDNDYVSIKVEDKSCSLFTNELSEEGSKIFKGKKVGEQVHVAFRTALKDEKNVLRILKITDHELEEENMYERDVTIESIGRITPAELNEDFFKKAYPDGSVTTVEQLEKVVAEQIESQWKQYTDRQFMNDAIGVLIENIKFDIPDDFTKRYILMSQTDLTAEKLDAQYEDYQKSIKWSLLENKLVRRYNVSVSREEVEEFVRNFFMTNYFNNFKYEDVKERVDSLVTDALKKKDDLKNIYDQIYDRKLMEVFRANFNIEEKNGSYQDFVDATSKGEEKETKKKATKAAKAKKEDGEVVKEAKPKKTSKKAAEGEDAAPKATKAKASKKSE